MVSVGFCEGWIMSVITAPRISQGMKKSVDQNRTWQIWQWCSDAYLRYGHRLALPANTDPCKTYQWRYVTAISGKFDEWGFDDQTAQKFINLAVEYAKKINMLWKGLAVLHQNNMLDKCYEMLQNEIDTNNHIIEGLKRSKDWVDRQTNKTSSIDILLSRPNEDAFCNLTMWYRSNKITDLYLALSKKCCQALTMLDKVERSVFPSKSHLYMMRTELSGNVHVLKAARQILFDDWRELCKQL